MLKHFAFALAAFVSCVGIYAADDVKPGLLGEYFELDNTPGDFPQLPADKKPGIRRVDRQINVESCTENFDGTNLSQNFYVRWTGSVKIDKAGKYKFAIESDDGSRVIVDGKPLIDNNGSHAMTKKEGTLDLTPGQHELKIEFFQGTGEMGCKFTWTPPGKGEEIVPEAVLWHKADGE